MAVSMKVRDLGLAKLLTSVQALAFDLDGTLCNSIGNIISCTNFTFDVHNYRRPDESSIIKTIGLRLEEGLRELLPDEHKQEYLEFTASYREIFAQHPEFMIDTLYPGVPELMQKLKKRGIKIGFVSGRCLKGIERTLSNTVLGDYCDAISAGDEAPSKPDPALMYLLSKRLKIACKDMLGVGDALIDIYMYKSSGAKALGVQSGVNTAEELQKASPDFLLPFAGDLNAYF